jgi:hypothetical protein
MDNNQWVKIEPGCELPAYDRPVLTYDTEGNIIVCELERQDAHGSHWIVAGINGDWENVTHWAPLPEAPLGAAPAQPEGDS